MSYRIVQYILQDNIKHLAGKEVIRMSEKERGDIMEALKELPEKDKQFVLGYAAGVSATIGKNDEKAS